MFLVLGHFWTSDKSTNLTGAFVGPLLSWCFSLV